jgi:hypothetical protein
MTRICVPRAAARALVILTIVGCSAADISSLVDAVQPRSVKIEAPRTDVQVKDTLRLTATARDSSGAIMAANALLVPTWSQTGGSGIVLIGSDGLATGNAPGPVEVTATIRGVRGTIALNVVNLAIDSVAFTTLGYGCAVGGRTSASVQTFLKGQPVTVRGRTFNWSVSTDGIVQLGAADPNIPWERSFVCAAPGSTTIVVNVEGARASFPVVVSKQ